MLDDDKYYGESKSKETVGSEKGCSSELKGQGMPCWDGDIWLKSCGSRKSQPKERNGTGALGPC